MTHELFRHVNTNVSVIGIECNINIVAFCVNSASKQFLTFLLERKGEGDLTFVSVRGPVPNLRDVCSSLFPEGVYGGYVIFNKEVYAFVKGANVSFAPLTTFLKGAFNSNKCNRWMCLVDEVLNYMGVLGGRIRIDPRCAQFLFSNADYYTLTGCDIPRVAFLTSDSVNQTEIDYHFGPTRRDYDNYVFESCDELDGKMGAVRYAIFGTEAETVSGRTRWFVRSLSEVVSLTYHSLLDC